jgi:enoyl-CoA hydratase/carnithine racemase
LRRAARIDYLEDAVEPKSLSVKVPVTLGAREVEELRRTLAAAREASAIVLEGSDGVFCRGLDPSANLLGHAEREAAIEAFADCLGILRRSPAPSVAVVDGEALGGGLGLAAVCDVVIATPRATFSLPETLHGLQPAMILAALLERMPPQKARLLALTPHARGAEEARALGLVDEIATASVRSSLSAWLRALRRPKPQAVAALKSFTLEIAGLPFSEAVRRGAARTAEALATAPVQAALRDLARGDRS